MLISCWAYHLTLKADATSLSETSVLQRTTRHYIPEDRTLDNNRGENLEFDTILEHYRYKMLLGFKQQIRFSLKTPINIVLRQA
jgi:hypothetical protein